MSTGSLNNPRIINLISGKKEVITTNDKIKQHHVCLAADKGKLVTWISRINEEGSVGEWSFYMFRPGCFPGMYSEDFEKFPYRSCPRGTFSDKPGARNCVKCPGEMTTSLGSTSLENCKCNENACYHGEFSIRSDYTTLCVCEAGYTGKNCQYPTQFLIGLGQ